MFFIAGLGFRPNDITAAGCIFDNREVIATVAVKRIPLLGESNNSPGGKGEFRDLSLNPVSSSKSPIQGAPEKERDCKQDGDKEYGECGFDV